MMLRFSKLIQDIYEELDDKSLANCKIASKSWCDLNEDKKFPSIRKTWKNSNTNWVKLVVTTPLEIVNELAIPVVYQC